jgi:hypothetical protein
MRRGNPDQVHRWHHRGEASLSHVIGHLIVTPLEVRITSTLFKSSTGTSRTRPADQATAPMTSSLEFSHPRPKVWPFYVVEQPPPLSPHEEFLDSGFLSPIWELLIVGTMKPLTLLWYPSFPLGPDTTWPGKGGSALHPVLPGAIGSPLTPGPQSSCHFTSATTTYA